MIKRAIILAVLIPIAAVCWAEPATVMILPFDNATGQTDLNALQGGIRDLLTASLADHSDAVQVVEREKLDAIMAEKSLTWENVMSDKGAARLAQLVQARYILRGSFAPDNAGLRIETFLYETESTRLLKTIEVEGPRKELSQLSDKIAADVSAVVLAKKDPLPADADPETNLVMTHGLGYYHQNEFSKAIPEFMKVLENHPQHADAKYWLVKSYVGARLNDNAVLEAKEFLQAFPNDPRAAEIRGIKP